MRWALLLALLSTSALASRADRLSVSPRLDRRDRLGAASASSPILLSLSLMPPDSECSGTPPDGVTFTRSSAATCISNDGQTAYNLTTNQARVDGTLGLLVEGATTNILLRSQRPDIAPWTNPCLAASTSGMAGNSTRGCAPGTVSQDIAPAAGARVASVYVRRGAGVGCTVALSSTEGSATTPTIPLGDFDTTWQRLVLPYTAAGGTVTIALTVGGASCTYVATDLWQDEAGSIATSPVVSAGTAATRAGERALVPSAGLSEMKGCAALSFAPDWSVSPPDPPMSGGYYALSGFENVGMNRLLYANPTSTTVAAYGGSAATTAQANTVYAAGVAQRYVSQWDASTPVQTVCSESACSNAPGPFAGYPVFGSELYLGSRSTSLAHVYGYLSNLVLGNSPGACQ